MTSTTARTTINPKVTAATVAGAVTVILVWLAGELGFEVPPEPASAFTLLLTAAAGYLKRDHRPTDAT